MKDLLELCTHDEIYQDANLVKCSKCHVLISEVNVLVAGENELKTSLNEYCDFPEIVQYTYNFFTDLTTISNIKTFKANNRKIIISICLYYAYIKCDRYTPLPVILRKVGLDPNNINKLDKFFTLFKTQIDKEHYREATVRNKLVYLTNELDIDIDDFDEYTDIIKDEIEQIRKSDKRLVNAKYNILISLVLMNKHKLEEPYRIEFFAEFIYTSIENLNKYRRIYSNSLGKMSKDIEMLL